MPRTAVAQNGELRFYRIQVADAGRYRCTATSPVGTADSVAEVVVNGKTFSKISVITNVN